MPNNEGDQLNTGSPGFEVPDIKPNTSYTYDVGDPDREQGTSIPTDKGNMSVEGDEAPKKDISKSTKEVLSLYLGKKTSVNYYPVDRAATTSKISLEGLDGKQKTPIVGNISNSRHYPKPNVQQGVEPTYDGSVDSSPDLKRFKPEIKYVPPRTNLSGLVKGKTFNFETDENNVKNGNQLLQQVKKNDLGTLTKYTETVLTNNRFTGLELTTGRDKFAQFMGPESTEQLTTNLSLKSENLENLETNLNKFNPRVYNPKYPNFTLGKMAQVGVALSTRASLEIGTLEREFNPTSEPSELKAILPSLNQLGVASIDTTNLTAEDVMRNLSYSNEVQNYVNINSKSWGNMNNIHDQYDGLSALGMMALSLATIAAMTLLFEGIALILGSGSRTVSSVGGRRFSGNSTLHHTGASEGPFQYVQKLLGLPFTANPYKKAVKAGINAYFGIDDSGGLLGAVASAFSSPLSKPDTYLSPGYKIVICRSVIRSIVTIVEAISNIKGANTVSTMKNILSLVETIRKSKLISTIKIFANLGDQLLNDKGGQTLVNSMSNEPARKSTIDMKDDNLLGSSTTKSRLSQGNVLKLAWASNRTHSLYLLPNNVAALQPIMRDLGSFQNGYLGKEEYSMTKYHFAREGERIPYDDNSINAESVEMMESLIDSTDHVPLYFHDIRTNEIISFHAFLDNFSDSFSPSYDSVDGFGRVEPVKIYKGTTRKIDISFHIISTSRKDFDEMWIKINKLVTLVYPQYTEGRRLVQENYTFTQPFSQMIGASPLIRLRLGNLVSTNYSRFALARLFGATFEDSKFNGKQFSATSTEDTYKKVAEEIEFRIDNPEWPGKVTSWVLLGGVASLAPNKPSIPGVSPEWIIDDYSKYLKIKITGTDNNGNVIISPEIPKADFLKYQGVTSESQQKRLIEYLKDKFDDLSKNPKTCVTLAQYSVSKKQLRISGESYNQIYNSFSNSGEFVKELGNFLDPEKNALVKSFKSTAGKGLAGFIDSLQFDWGGTSARWEIDPDARAPQTCKVSLSFTPVHDISPGLDSHGYNRAPVYPIGPYAHGRDTLKK